MRSSKTQILDKRSSAEGGGEGKERAPAASAKLRSDEERGAVRKREHKALMKSLTMAQLATASMGKFDKKLRREPDAPKTQRLAKKISNKALGALEADRGGEKKRSLKMLELLARKAEQGESGAGAAKPAKKASAGKNRRPSSKGPKRGVAEQGKKTKKGAHRTVKN